jgi:hypothetical protein
MPFRLRGAVLAVKDRVQIGRHGQVVGLLRSVELDVLEVHT